ncbi:hypothetical protein NHQ30_009708 [Ciborinia camelliae]|nr:hypothetical protein NHQ30_009708 [Ciborinia camelliae]
MVLSDGTAETKGKAEPKAGGSKTSLEVKRERRNLDKGKKLHQGRGRTFADMEDITDESAAGSNLTVTQPVIFLTPYHAIYQPHLGWVFPARLNGHPELQAAGP